MRALKFKDAFFASVNQMFGGSFQPLTPEIVEHSSDNKTVLGSSWKLGGAAEHLIDSSKNAFVG